MAGTIIVDRLESDASYASSINIASPLVVSNTISLGSAAAITGNVNIDSGLLFVNAVNNRVGINTTTLAANTSLCVSGDIKLNYTTPTNANARIYALNSTFDPYTLALSGGAAINFQRISNSDEIAFETHHTGNTHREVMRISKEGRVTKPYQPAFDAYGTVGNESFTSERPIPLNSTTFNVGSHYNTSTYRFTAPVAGIYFFRAHVYKQSSGNASRLRFYKNGSDVRIYQYISASDVFTHQITGILSLAVNDYVTCTFNGDGAGTSIYLADNHTNFSGYFLG